VNVGRALALGAALLVLSSAGGKDARRPAGDLIFRHPQFAQLAPASIALLPAASFDGNSERERLLTVAWAANLGGGGYRWMSASTSRAILSSDSTGQALMAAARAAVLQKARLDSTIAQRMCRKLRVQAVLGVRLDDWESQSIDPQQSGKPFSRAWVRTALIDSTGRLLWSAEGSETVEGTEHQALSDGGIGAGAPRSDFATGEGAAPKADDVFQRIASRWAAAFPPRPAAPDSAR
jgi:hypothetical protein